MLFVFRRKFFDAFRKEKKMKNIRNRFTAAVAVGLMIFASFATEASAQRSRVNEREVRDTLRRLAVKLDDFRYNLDYELKQQRASQADEDAIFDSFDDLQRQVTDFQNRFSRRRDSQQDVSNLLAQAKTVDENLYRLRLNSNLQREWTGTKDLFDRLASNYGVNWDWRGGGNYPTTGNYPSGNFSRGLTGTYQLDAARSENTNDIAERAIGNANIQNRDEARRDLEQKIEAPQQLAIEVRGNQIKLASSLAPRVTVTADGRDRTETLADGRTLRIRTALVGQELTISSVGGDNEYTVTFVSTDSGRSMRVTRRVTTDYLNQAIVAESVYAKTDSVARFDIYDGGTNNYPSGNTGGSYPPTTTTGRTGNFIVPNGTIITGTLENEITTKASQNNDRFSMTVSAPNEFRGAIIEGYISGINRSGKVTGRSQLTLNFERIRMPNGDVYDFAGFLQSVTDTNGKTVKIDTEGTARGDSQTKETVKRGGIGAGLGAIIGAIAGGAKGAAIGAIIGGSAGAGSVYIQGKEDLELKPGSSITVQASSPVR
jgi:hypothetical protein